MLKHLRHFYGGIKGIIIVVFSFSIFPFARLFLWRKKIWIVSEFGYEARDNGYSFFKFIRQIHPEINCFYTIDFKSQDYQKIKDLGNIIRFGSFKHYCYWCAARFIISSKTQGFCPNYYLTLLRKKMHLWGKYVFLQHGITKDNQKFLYKKPSKIDLFICGAKPEYEDIQAHYGYKDDEVVYTGFARFDDYFGLTSKNQILVMPTWRRYAENVKFMDTEYFKTWFDFINSEDINKLLVAKKMKMYFYLHPHFKEYSSLFVTECSNIIVLPFESTDLQKLIKESLLLITDFSSLAFDFGYMRKQVFYYQYDEKEYFDKHYIKGYFDYRRDGFGPVCNSIDSLISELKSFLDNPYVSSGYLKNSERFFVLCDSNNCSRIFDAITSFTLKLKQNQTNQ